MTTKEKYKSRKPIARTQAAAYDYNQIAKYIEEKYNIKLRDFENGRDFWRFLLDRCDIHRGCYIYISDETGDGAEQWQKDIINIFLKEFGKWRNGTAVRCWVDW